MVYCKILKGINEDFNDYIFIDETTIEMSNLGRYRWHKKISNETGKNGIYAHNVTVHVLAGISRKGATGAVIFNGKMKAFDFQNLFSLTIIPFINQNFPNGHHLIMDNSTPHSAHYTKLFLADRNINHFQTPAQSPVAI